MTRVRIWLYEAIVPKLMLRAARLRLRRNEFGDQHEIRHLYAAVSAGDSTACTDQCHLDGAWVQ